MSVAEALDRLPLFSSVAEADRRSLASVAELRVLRRRETLWVDGEPTRHFTFVLRGSLKLVKSSEVGRETIVDLALRDQMLCTNAVCAQLPYCCRAVAMEDDTEVLLLPSEAVAELMDRDPALSRSLLTQVTTRGTTLCRRVEELASGQVERRIATLLLRLAEQIGQERVGEGVWIPVALSRQDLADMCGTTVETTIRVMSRFKRDAVVRTVARGFVVPDLDALQQVARGIPPK